MRILRDRRGTAAFEFCLIAGTFFLFIFAIIDFGRYAITMQSLKMLADAGARAVMINCYTPAVIANPPTSPSSCAGKTVMTTTAMQNVAPFLFAGGLTPTLNVTLGTAGGSNVLQVKAQSPDFAMLVTTGWTTWDSVFKAPSATTSIPY